MTELRIGMIGTGFMGEAHSRGYKAVESVFSPDRTPVLQALCGRDEQKLRRVASRYGWKNIETDWHALVSRDDVDLIDISVPNDMHKDIVLEASSNGKDILCEKPLARNTVEAQDMLYAARANGVRHMVAFCNRRIPAVAFARQLIDQGVLGRVFHWRATWRADWAVDASQPLTWRFNRQRAGSGALGDIASHLIDLARYLVGDIDAVMGMTKTFIQSRPLAGDMGKKGTVNVDDAALFLARFKNGAIGTFEASRFCSGEREHFGFEINGEEGSIRFDYSDINKLFVWQRMSSSKLEGFKEITMDSRDHPYFPWDWGGGHGKTSYSDLFVNQAYALIQGTAKGEQLTPSFEDGLLCQAVTDCVLRSSEENGRWVLLDEVLRK